MPGRVLCNDINQITQDRPASVYGNFSSSGGKKAKAGSGGITVMRFVIRGM